MKKTYLDFTAYLWRRHSELDPAYIKRCEAYLATLPAPGGMNPFDKAANRKQQDASRKPQAARNKQRALEINK